MPCREWDWDLEAKFMVNLKVSTQASELWGCRVLTYTQENPRGELCCEWTHCIKCYLYRAGAGLHWPIGCANSASSTAVHPFNRVFVVPYTCRMNNLLPPLARVLLLRMWGKISRRCPFSIQNVLQTLSLGSHSQVAP